MYTRKSRRDSREGLDPFSYYNTRDNSNTPIIQTDGGSVTTKRLPPTADSPTVVDTTTVKPKLHPIQPQPNGMMLLFGLTGRVYVVLSKPTADAAVVVVEVSHEDMFYAAAKDTNYLGGTPAVAGNFDINHPNIVKVINTITAKDVAPAYMTKRMVEEAITHLSEHSTLLQQDDVLQAVTWYNAATTVTGGATVGGDLTAYIYTGELDLLNTPSMLNAIPPPSPAIPYKVVQWGSYPVRYVPDEVVKTTKRTFDLSTHMILVIEFAVNYTHVVYVLEAKYDLRVTYAAFGEPGYGGCPPNVIPTGGTNSETHVWDDSIEWVRRQSYTNQDTRGRVRRGYTNIGGKLTYLYTVSADATTDVLLNYDGTNYGLVVSVTEENDGQTETKRYNVSQSSTPPSAAYLNNITGIGLSESDRTNLQPVLQQPAATNQTYSASIPSATSYKAYGFAPLLYANGSNDTNGYNDLIIKAVAVYD